jgi:hypothetical protein
LDYQDVKLKIVQQEGYDAHDFNLFDDRSSELWRKPYVDGAVRELTAGDSRSQEQLRRAVEQMMLAAGNKNPDVRTTSLPPAAHKTPTRAGENSPGLERIGSYIWVIDQPRGSDSRGIAFSSVKKLSRSGKAWLSGHRVRAQNHFGNQVRN